MDCAEDAATQARDLQCGIIINVVMGLVPIRRIHPGSKDRELVTVRTVIYGGFDEGKCW